LAHKDGTIALELVPNPSSISAVSLQTEMHKLLADKIERDPSLLRVPLENIDRWLGAGHTERHRLEQWRGILTSAQQSAQAFASLLQLLRDESEESIHLKSFNPFPGVLTSEERQRIIVKCVFSH